MPNLIDFYKGIILPVLPDRIVVLWLYKDVDTTCRLSQILTIFCSTLT